MDETNGSLIAWVLAGVGAVVSTLSITVAKLFHINLSKFKEVEVLLRKDIEELRKSSQKCEDDRQLLHGTCEKLKGKLEEIEKRMK